MLVKVKGTPLANNEDIHPFDFIRTIVVARIMMRASYVRLFAGREQMNEQRLRQCALWLEQLDLLRLQAVDYV